MVSPHGIPSDLLDRILIIVTKPYKIEEILAIVMIRAEAEGVKLDDEAITHLGKLGTGASLRYVVQLLTPAKLLAQASGRDIVMVCISGLFIICAGDGVISHRFNSMQVTFRFPLVKL